MMCSSGTECGSEKNNKLIKKKKRTQCNVFYLAPEVISSETIALEFGECSRRDEVILITAQSGTLAKGFF